MSATRPVERARRPARRRVAALVALLASFAPPARANHASSAMPALARSAPGEPLAASSDAITASSAPTIPSSATGSTRSRSGPAPGFAPPSALADNYLHLARVRVAAGAGALDLSAPAHGELRLERGTALRAPRELLVPLSRRPTTVEGAPFRTSGEIEFLAWLEERPDERWLSLPFGLRLRSRPVLASERVAPNAAALGALGVALVSALVLRRRPLLALVTLPLGVAWVVGAQRVGAADAPSGVRVLEVDAGPGGEGAAILVDARRDELVLRAADDGLRLETEPASARPTWTVVFGSEDAAPTFHARAAGATLIVARRHLGPLPDLTDERNDFRALAEVHRRDGSGSWTAHGAWALGQALPERIVGEVDPPPAWLTGGLAPGRPVVIGRLAETAWPLAREREAIPTWVRWVGP